jgi:hypothetical protein
MRRSSNAIEPAVPDAAARDYRMLLEDTNCATFWGAAGHETDGSRLRLREARRQRRGR